MNFGIVKLGIVESVLKREVLLFIFFEEMVILYVDFVFINELYIVIVIFKNLVKWGLVEVDKIFFIVLIE